MGHKIKENLKDEDNSEKKAFVIFFQNNGSTTSVKLN